MRSRNALSAVLGALVAGLVAVIVSLVGCAGRGANADPAAPTPTATPATTEAADHPAGVQPGRVVVRGGSGGGSARTTTKSTPRLSATKTGPPTQVPPRRAEPPRLGTASVPDGADYNASPDRQAFTMRFSTLEAGTDKALSRSLSTTIAITGDTRDAVLELGVSGFAFTDNSTKAKLTITANGSTLRRSFYPDSEREFVQTFDVPLHGANRCSITLKVEVQPDPAVRGDGYINVSALDGQFARP